MGRTAYPDADRLMITADAGGSNAYRSRMFKAELAKLAPSRSGWSSPYATCPPAPRSRTNGAPPLFSFISMNWRGKPLTSHEIVVQTIAATTTRAGLTVTAELDTASYPKGIKISDRQITDLEQTQVLTRHQFHGEWNYTLTPPHDTPEPS